MNEVVKTIRAMNKKKLRTTLERLVYTNACAEAIEMIIRDLENGRDPHSNELDTNKTLAHELVYLRAGDPVYGVRFAIIDMAKYQYELDGGANTRDILLLVSLKFPDQNLTPVTGIPVQYKQSVSSLLKLAGFEQGHAYKKDLSKTVRVWRPKAGFDHLSSHELQLHVEKQLAMAEVAIDRSSENNFQGYI